jgi:hypothetical protein
MNLFLASFAEQVEPGTHVVLLVDQAGWHVSGRLAVPESVTLLDGYKVVLDAAWDAWNALAAETGRPASLSPCLLRSELQ